MNNGVSFNVAVVVAVAVAFVLVPHAVFVLSKILEN